ncbi:hypothetical protein AAFF_G00057020 [Aldrovandia affinis]|uniref:Uncharacterized protein n=1 Tax=Aldrovandia affinis TaxID=143900 RepID=A0AAD7S114_9TELE|nr:hypothetical protein AAFF_G00057020 [Aldrovandia affinis]
MRAVETCMRQINSAELWLADRTRICLVSSPFPLGFARSGSLASSGDFGLRRAARADSLFRPVGGERVLLTVPPSPTWITLRDSVALALPFGPEASAGLM